MQILFMAKPGARQVERVADCACCHHHRQSHGAGADAGAAQYHQSGDVTFNGFEYIGAPGLPGLIFVEYL